MPERERKQKPAPEKREEVVEDVPATSERGEKLKEDIDDLLDEIDSVLEDNAEEFVRNYVQKGWGMTDLFGHVSPAKILHASARSSKPLIEFYSDRRAPRRPPARVQGLQSRQPCGASTAKNPRPAIERAQRWRLENPERYQARMQ